MKKQMKKVEIENIVLDEELYPRSQMSWQVAYKYANEMQAGSKFPAVTLALSNNKLLLVDGWHRINACKQNKITTIDAEILIGLSRKEIFKKAIELNSSHGFALSPYEKRKIALRLRDMKFSNKQVSELIKVPLDKLENFIGQRLVNSLTGKIIVKSGLKHLSKQEVVQQPMEVIEEVEKTFNEFSEIAMIDKVISLLENDLVDRTNPKVIERLERLRELI